MNSCKCGCFTAAFLVSHFRENSFNYILFVELRYCYDKQKMQIELCTKVKEQQDALITVVKHDHSFVNSNNTPC